MSELPPLDDEMEELRGGGLQEEGAPTWMVTFGDMMSLLLTFFILLFSMSELRVERFLLATESFREALGGTSPEAPEDPLGLMPDPVDPELTLQHAAAGEAPAAPDPEAPAPVDVLEELERLADAYMEAIAQRLREFIEENGLEDVFSVERSTEGVYLRMQSVALFESGSGTVAPGSRWILEYLSEITGGLDVRARVSGHADDRPIRTAEFASNWELSAVRAAGVTRALVEHGHDPTMIRVESFAEHRPVASNATEVGRARNRRVEVFFSRSDILDAVRRWMEEGLPAPAVERVGR